MRGPFLLVLFVLSAVAQETYQAAPPAYAESSSDEVNSWFDAQKAQGKQVVSLGGYSGAGYEDEARAEQEVERRLKSLSRSRTIINGGVTSDGIGDIGYRVAKRLGFQTVGIVSAKAIQNKDANGNLIAPSVSKDVDRSFFVKDDTWGGRGADGKLSPTSEAWVRNSDRYIAVGGNAVARDEAMEMLNRGKRVNVVQMDLNREKLRKKMAAKTAKARETDPNAPEQVPTDKDFAGMSGEVYDARRSRVMERWNARKAERAARALAAATSAPAAPRSRSSYSRRRGSPTPARRPFNRFSYSSGGAHAAVRSSRRPVRGAATSVGRYGAGPRRNPAPRTGRYQY